jgi:hypothetical protein
MTRTPESRRDRSPKHKSKDMILTKIEAETSSSTKHKKEKKSKKHQKASESSSDDSDIQVEFA